jgi:ferrous iron transport protein B
MGNHIMKTIALVGNPNCGKTTLFNTLTGSHQRVGNWPGVTVERKSGIYKHADTEYEVIDLPGTYSLNSNITQTQHADANNSNDDSIDEQIAQQFIRNKEADLIINVLDASSLERGLYLTSQLFESDIPMIVALNMIDVAHSKGMHLDHQALSEQLGCPVVPLVASKGDGLITLMDSVENRLLKPPALQRSLNFTNDAMLSEPALIQARYEWVDQACQLSMTLSEKKHKTLSEYIDDIVLNRVLALPIFMGVMYLLFMFAINVGSAFIDFFDITAGALFVESPRWLLESINAPAWLTALIADGIGGGMQLVASFIPVIAALFLSLSF